MSEAPDDELRRDYMVVPDQPGPKRALLVVHSGRGLTEYVEFLCQRLSHVGFVTLAVDLFDGETPTRVGEAEAVKAATDRDEILRRLDDSVHLLRTHESTVGDPVAVLGLGYGATWAIDLAEQRPSNVGAIVLFYGLTGCDWSGIDARVQGHFAELDQEIPPSRIERLRHTLQSEDVPHELFVYEGCEPSFFEKEPTARYDPSAADVAWQRLTRFLRS